ncbi:hypothetical protein [Candidatus Poriferisodalis sp.]|uniref:hypothetical protein n=1 Tax=Candidatus Poriferisodalis sp. TaxID=3101277 RepID=UPI003B02DB2F
MALGLLGVACIAQQPTLGAAAIEPAAQGLALGSGNPVVTILPPTDTARFLDPDAQPATELGWLRAQYLPVWSPALDLAFPPSECGSAWALDAIAEPARHADLRVIGHLPTAAALAVMRYEHLVSRALSAPDAVSQLCVAVASLDPVRASTLALLASHQRSGERHGGGSIFPDEVTVVAVGDTRALALACVEPGYSEILDAEGTTRLVAAAPTRIAAYLLVVAAGREDRVPDVDYRVADVASEPASDCSGIDAEVEEWAATVSQWIDTGQIWVLLGDVLTAAAICEEPPPEGPDECPQDWPA